LVHVLFFYFVQVHDNAASPKGTKSSSIHPSSKHDLNDDGAPSTANAPEAPFTADAPDVNNTAVASKSLSASPGSQGAAYSEKVALSFGINRREVCTLNCLCVHLVVDACVCAL
jgi:hypothetical protein